MAYNNKNREEQSLAHKNRIIEAARRLVHEKGYDSVSVSDITEAAGVSKGAFYIHYKSKEEVISDLVNFVFEDIKTKADEMDPYEAICYFLKASSEKILRSGLKIVQTWLSEAVSGAIYGKNKIRYDINVVKSYLMKAGYDDAQANAVALKIISLHYGALTSWCISDGGVEPLDILSDMLEHNLKVLKDRMKEMAMSE